MTDKELAAIDLNNGIQTYRTSLVKLYKDKAKLISQRELNRFRYISNLKSKLDSIFSSILARSFETALLDEYGFGRDSKGKVVLERIVNRLRSAIPMVNSKGAMIDGWNGPPFYLGGELEASFFSPITHLIDEPFYTHADYLMKPVYQINYKDGISAGDIEYNTRMAWAIDWLQANDPRAGNRTVGFSIPANRAWIEAMGTSGTLPEEVINFVNEILETQFPIGNLKDTIEETKNLMWKIVDETMNIINLQVNIDRQEQGLKTFIEDYSQLFSDLDSFDNILKSIKDEANQVEEVKKVEPQVIPAVPQEVISVEPQPAVEKKSNMALWLALGGAAVLGILNG